MCNILDSQARDADERRGVLPGTRSVVIPHPGCNYIYICTFTIYLHLLNRNLRICVYNRILVLSSTSRRGTRTSGGAFFRALVPWPHPTLVAIIYVYAHILYVYIYWTEIYVYVYIIASWCCLRLAGEGRGRTEGRSSGETAIFI